MIPQRNKDGKRNREGKQAFVAPEPVANGAADSGSGPTAASHSASRKHHAKHKR